MRRFLVYTRLQFKRMAGYAPFVFLVTLLIGLCLAVAATALVKSDASDEDKSKIGIGIVGDLENSYLDFGVSAIKSFDSSRFFLDMIECDEAEAKELLLKKEIAGYVVIPEGFVDDAIYGNVGKLTFVTTDSSADIIDIFKQEVLDLISCVLVESQKGVYGLQNAMRGEGSSYGEISDEVNEMSLEYVKLILSRSNAFEVEIIGFSDSLTFGGYILSGICVLLVLLSGIICCPMFIRRDYSFPKLMSANRCRAFSQTAGEYIAFFALIAINGIALLWIIMMSLGGDTQIIPEFSESTAVDILKLLLCFIPAIALVTAFQYLLYQLSDSVVSGVLMQFVSAVILGYLSGCFYPISFFPQSIQAVSKALPSGIAREYLSSLIADSASLLQVACIVVYTAALLTASVLVRGWRMRKE